MRRRDCLSAHCTASSLQATWAAARTLARHYTPSSPAAAAAASATTTDLAAVEAEKGRNSEESRPAPPKEPSLHEAAAAVSGAPQPTTAAAADTLPTKESVAEATERLRAALRALSVVEQAKSDESQLKARQAVDGIPRVTPEPGGEVKSSTAPSVSASGSSSTAPLTTDNTTAAAPPSSTSPVSRAAATSSWIRNKRPKFWALVNETGAADEASVANSTPAAAAPATARDSSVRQRELRAAPASVPGRDDTSASVSPSAVSPPAIGVASSIAAPSATSSEASAVGATTTSVSAQSIRAAASVPPFRSRYKKDVAHALSALLNSDATLGPQLLGQLSAESRRLMLIMGTASEYFGGDYNEVAEQIKEADTDRDNSISSKEFDAWVGHMAGMASHRRHDAAPDAQAPTARAPAAATTELVGEPATLVGASGAAQHNVAASATLARQRAEMAAHTARAASARIIEVMQKNVAAAPVSQGEVAQSAAAPAQGSSSPQATTATAVPVGMMTTARAAPAVEPPATSTAKTADAPAATASLPSTKPQKGDPAFIPWPTFARIVLAAAPPFLAFGMLDNCTLVLAGGAIDNILSAKLGLTQMAAASLGGVVSGVAGIQVHGLAERFTRARPPLLTPEQEQSDSFLRAESVGNTLGMVVGLIIGMTPLLFMRRSSQVSEKEAEEHKQFRDEATRSHQRQCKQAVGAETRERQALVKEERAAWEEVTRELAVPPPLPV